MKSITAIFAAIILVLTLASCGTSVPPVPTDNTPVKCSDGTTATPPAKCPTTPPTPVKCWNGTEVVPPATCPVQPQPIANGTVGTLQIKEGKLFLTKMGFADTEVKFMTSTTVGIKRADGQIKELGLASGAIKGSDFAMKVTQYFLGLGTTQAFITGDGRQGIVFTFWQHTSLNLLPDGQTHFIPGDKVGMPEAGGWPIDAPAAELK